MNKYPWKTILLAGLLVGTLDISGAFINYYIQTGNNPVRVLKYIASAFFGKQAYDYSPAMPAIGLFMHYLIAMTWTILFFLVYPRLKFLSLNRLVTGILYGLFIWLVMSRLLVPLTRAATGAFTWKSFAIGASILIVAIGLPLSFIAYRFYQGKENAPAI
jgi:hypothetical protein